jgi:hypothetical protein
LRFFLTSISISLSSFFFLIPCTTQQALYHVVSSNCSES